MANAGCKAPLMMAQMVPTKMYGHSERLRRITLENGTRGIFSSCKEGGTELSLVTSTPDFFPMVGDSVN